MEPLERCDQLLQKQLIGSITQPEMLELSELLKTDAQALDHYLDLCELDLRLAVQRPADVVVPAQAERSWAFSALPATVAVTAAAILLVAFAWAFLHLRQAPKGMAMQGDAASPVPTDASPAAAPRRTPNPWKVIRSTGSMNHPSLTEASVPQVRPVANRPIKFNRDIRPILSETCFHCHGPDEEGRRADLRLDTLDGATADLGGYRPIAPGDVSQSEAWNRITSEDPDLLMPPPESHLVLSADQKTLLKRWIQEGAEYDGHWAFSPPQPPKVPEINFASSQSQAVWGRNAIDAFVAARLADSGMTPSVEADARTLIRRLTLDLTGLPPTLEQIRQFEQDYPVRGEDAYQTVVTRLLQSPHFGERMAIPWLDQARYADTNGYSIDGGRHMWLWRDWVIQAYNDNMPFDQFAAEQLAGDLMPEATDSQKIASGFNRNHMVTHEGGTIPEENLTNYAADRVKTTGEVFLGLTLGCAQCHDHKYDPISQKEYYQFFAFFNELDDRGLDGNAGTNPSPSIMAPTVLRTDEITPLEQELQQLEQQLSETTEGFEDWLARERERERSRGLGFQLRDAELLDVSSPNRPGPFEFSADGSVVVSKPAQGLNGFSHSLRMSTEGLREGETVSGLRIEFLPHAADADSEPVLTPFDDGVPKVTTVLVSANIQPADQVDLYRQIGFSQATSSSEAPGHTAASVLDERNVDWWQPEDKATGQRLTLTFDRSIDPRETPYLSVLVFFGRNQSMPYRWKIQPFSGKDTDSRWNVAVAEALQKDSPESWDAETHQSVLQTFREHAEILEPLRTRLANLRDRRDTLTAEHSTMVMNTAEKPRETFVLRRGQYDSPAERVTPDTPRILPALFETAVPAQPGDVALETEAIPTGPRPTRLDLAHWLTSAKHPLTSRVAVNRLWAIFFGTGIVATSADFGSQGEYPSHPDLLEFLATRFVESGWNQKQLIREIVSSATYRQQSHATAEQLEIDPKNRLLGRGPRFRLPAELIRDQALAVSGLLVRRIGGPSVHPYQPHSLWKEVSHFGSTPATKQVFVQDHGEKLYRRSLYTITKRTSPHPALAAFDAPNREMCTVERGITNTPMQALVTLNDPQFAEAARVLSAVLLQDESASNDTLRIARGFERVVSRLPSDREIRAVQKLLESERQRYHENPGDAARSVSVGEWPAAAGIEPAEHAAWMQVATLLLNLSETLTRN